jgi:peptidoglycan/xylan/chitin deacetylase (PgdA/CDA1 family)
MGRVRVRAGVGQRVAAVLCVVTLTLVAGCAGPGGATPAATTSPVGTPTPKITASPGTLEWYLAQIPQFAPAPTPVKIPVAAGDKAVVWHQVPTDQKVAFITIDDGQHQDPMWPELVTKAKVPVTSFLTYYMVWKSGDYFKSFQTNGGGINNHGKKHLRYDELPYAEQQKELCSSADRLGEMYGRQPILFRPPYGDYNDNTLKAVRTCGQKLAVLWTHAVDHGEWESEFNQPLEAGGIILLHFEPSFPMDLLVALQEISKAGLVPAFLEDYVG